MYGLSKSYQTLIKVMIWGIIDLGFVPMSWRRKEHLLYLKSLSTALNKPTRCCHSQCSITKESRQWKRRTVFFKYCLIVQIPMQERIKKKIWPFNFEFLLNFNFRKEWDTHWLSQPSFWGMIQSTLNWIYNTPPLHLTNTPYYLYQSTV